MHDGKLHMLPGRIRTGCAVKRLHQSLLQLKPHVHLKENTFICAWDRANQQDHLVADVEVRVCRSSAEGEQRMLVLSHIVISVQLGLAECSAQLGHLKCSEAMH